MSRACHMMRACMNEGELCDSCSRNLAFTDYFKAYNPTCRFGNDDCIHDPAYILCYHRRWYHEMWGDTPPNEVTDCCQCNDGSYYDWEDK